MGTSEFTDQQLSSGTPWRDHEGSLNDVVSVLVFGKRQGVSAHGVKDISALRGTAA